MNKTVPESKAADAGPGRTVAPDMEATVTAAQMAPAVVAPAEETIGSTIGRYQLLELTGEGGFGSVYVAEQKEPVRRRVALKVIKLGMDTKQVVARFEAERQALAMMDHPNIAKVFDAGATEAGRPYFVMELVQGEKITEYCDEHKLSTSQRLKLFIQVCRAIEHAHQKGIIHRDIKPSNILVTPQDGAAVPKVIDFGIAKATSGNLSDKTVFTQHDQFVGTPAYMSPEQAELSGADIDTRTDIYGLGVLLYELLTSETPFETKNLLARGLDEMRRIIREIEPPLPSLRLRAKGKEERTSTARRHGTDAPKLINLMRGDLDWVVMKCLEKDRSRRYESADSLAADVQRFLENEPVTARPPSARYRFQKLVRRNRLAFAAAGVVWLALVVALAVTFSYSIREKQALRLAEIETAAANHDRLNSDLARDQAQAAEKKAEEAQAQAEAALKKARDESEKARLADQQAQASKSEAQSARQAASAAKTQAQESDAEKAEALALETNSRRKAESWRTALSNVFIYADALPSNAVFTIGSALLASGDIPLWEAPLLRQRGEWRARQGDWAGAAADFSALLALQTNEPQPYAALASIQAQTGDSAGYARTCGTLLSRFGATNDLETKRLLAKTCLLEPATNIDLAACLALARQTAVAATNDLHFVAGALVLGLAEYRAGRFSEAGAQAAAALAAADQDAALQAQASAVLALARAQLNQTNLARATLTTGDLVLQSDVPKAESGDLGPHWEEVVAAQVLMQEAKSLIEVAGAGK
jgi:hypothetical protein